MQSYYAQQTGSTSDDGAIVLAERRAALELDLLAAVLTDPAACWPELVAEGITPGHFEQDDARAMYEAMAGEHSCRARALEAAWAALMAAGLTDESVPVATSAGWSCFWSAARLVHWSRGYLDEPDLEAVAHALAVGLVMVAERIERAEALADEYRRLVGEGVPA